jgi:hypothetical protein
MSQSNTSRQDLGVGLCPYNGATCGSGLNLTNASGNGLNNTAIQYYGKSIALPNVPTGGSCWYYAYSQCSTLNISAQSSNPNFKVSLLLTNTTTAANVTNPFANLTTPNQNSTCGNASIHFFATTYATTSAQRMLFENTEGLANL